MFRDETNLSAASDLTDAIRTALSNSRFFVYLASPEAANSKWVGDEIDIWRKDNPSETLLIVVTAGVVEWDDAQQDFNWERSTALHSKLKGFFSGNSGFVVGEHGFGPALPLDTVDAPILKHSAFGRGWDPRRPCTRRR